MLFFGRDSYERKLSNHHDQGRRQGATAVIEFFSVTHTSKNFEGARGRLCSSKGGRLCHGKMALWPVQAWVVWRSMPQYAYWATRPMVPTILRHNKRKWKIPRYSVVSDILNSGISLTSPALRPVGCNQYSVNIVRKSAIVYKRFSRATSGSWYEVGLLLALIDTLIVY